MNEAPRLNLDDWLAACDGDPGLAAHLIDAYAIGLADEGLTPARRAILDGAYFTDSDIDDLSHLAREARAADLLPEARPHAKAILDEASARGLALTQADLDDGFLIDAAEAGAIDHQEPDEFLEAIIQALREALPEA